VQFERLPIFTPTPPLDEVLTVRHVMASLTDEQLASGVTLTELHLSGDDTAAPMITPDP